MNWNNCNSTLSCDKDLTQVCFDVFQLTLPKINWVIAPNVRRAIHNTASD